MSFSQGFSVAIVVSDAEKSANWYKEKLGFEVSTEEEHWVTAWRNGSLWKLHLCQGSALEPGNSGIAFYSDDVKKTVDELKNNGVKFTQDYTKKEWGESAKFEDPDGNIFTLSNGEP